MFPQYTSYENWSPPPLSYTDGPLQASEDLGNPTLYPCVVCGAIGNYIGLCCSSCHQTARIEGIAHPNCANCLVCADLVTDLYGPIRREDGTIDYPSRLPRPLSLCSIKEIAGWLLDDMRKCRRWHNLPPRIVFKTERQKPSWWDNNLATWEHSAVLYKRQSEDMVMAPGWSWLRFLKQCARNLLQQYNLIPDLYYGPSYDTSRFGPPQLQIAKRVTDKAYSQYHMGVPSPSAPQD